MTDSILLKVNADLYNLTNASYFHQEDSYEFLHYMNEFCQEVCDFPKLFVLLFFKFPDKPSCEDFRKKAPLFWIFFCKNVQRIVILCITRSLFRTI